MTQPDSNEEVTEILTPRVIESDEPPRIRLQSEPESLRTEYVLSDVLEEVGRRKVRPSAGGAPRTVQHGEGRATPVPSLRDRSPSVHDETTRTDVALYDRPPPRERSVLVPWLGGAALGALLVGMGGWAFRALASTDTTTIDIRVSPADALVEVQGAEVKHPGTLRRSCSAPVKVTLRAPGFTTEHHFVPCGGEAILHVAMEPL